MSRLGIFCIFRIQFDFHFALNLFIYITCTRMQYGLLSRRFRVNIFISITDFIKSSKRPLGEVLNKVKIRMFTFAD
jgi:hypothetical protein